MFTNPVQLTDVIYNAANQCFEASVTIYDKGIARCYACEIEAPIDMSFEDAATGLKNKAMHHHAKKSGMHSFVQPIQQQQLAVTRKFDPSRWLQSLLNKPGQIAT